MLTRCARVAALIVFAGCLGLIAVPAAGLAATPLTCCKTSTPKFVDGRFTDWLEPGVALTNLFWRPEATSKPIYGGLYDLSGNVRLAWDDDQLFLAITVLDDLYLPAKDTPVDSGDCVLVRFAPADLPENGPVKPVEFCFTFAGAVLQQRDALGKWGKAEGVKMGTARSVLTIPKGPLAHEEGKQASARATKCWYELTIPWDQLPGITPQENGCMGLEIQVIDVDVAEAGIRGRLKWRGQPGVPRTATDFGRVIFVSADSES